MIEGSFGGPSVPEKVFIEIGIRVDSVSGALHLLDRVLSSAKTARTISGVVRRLERLEVDPAMIGATASL